MRNWLTERTRVIATLGVVEILAWGSSFYLLAVLAEPIRADTGWSAGFVTFGITLGLLASGLVARRVGAIIQAQGGRRVLAAGMVSVACGLLLLAVARMQALYLLGWLVIGVGMGAGLYDAAFSTLGRIYGAKARRAITALTLWGGFASTVCWPLTAFLADLVGWRGTCVVYAGLHLFVTAPLCLWALPRAQHRGAAPEPPAEGSTDGCADANGDGGAPEGGRFWMLAVTGTIMASTASLLSVHLMTILTSQGLALAAAVAVGALMGPAQVGARALEMLGRERHHPILTAMVSTALVAAGFAGLALGLNAGAALIAFGAGNGLWSITRGALPLALFGPDDYARTMGRLAAPALIGSAAAPSVGALMLVHLGTRGTLWALSLVALVALALMIALARGLRRESVAGRSGA